MEEFQLSGYDNRKELLAQRYNRGDLTVFVVAMPIHLVPTHLPIPDPDKPFENNRRVNDLHARKFGDWWRASTQWAVPPLLLDTTFPLGNEFEPKFLAGGVEFGVVKLPHNSANELNILDGQHRILGWSHIASKIVVELKDARDSLAKSKKSEDPVGIDTWQKKVDALNLDVERLRLEFVTLEILVGVDQAAHKQFFNDIAINAKGITRSVTTMFDQKTVLNRVAQELLNEDELLVGRVDTEKDRVVGKNKNMMSARNLSDIVRHVVLGIDGRMTARREAAFKDAAVENLSKAFLAALVESFDEMNKLIQEEIDPVDLRNDSLMGSTTWLRILAGVYHNLAVTGIDVDDPKKATGGDEKARALFAQLAKETKFVRVTGGTGVSHRVQDSAIGRFFPEATSKAPSSRSQDLKDIVKTLTAWGNKGEAWGK